MENTNKRLNVFFLISSALCLIVTVYVFYNTVFNQIISQNEGYLYTLIFGLILIIAFVICNLFTKLIAISDNNYEPITVKLTVIGILTVISALMLVLRMRYSTSVSPSEYPCYKIALALINDTYDKSQDLINDVMYNPGHFGYALILSLVLRIFDEGVKPVMWTNAVFIVGSLVLTYLIISKLTDRICGVFGSILLLLIPSQSFYVYSFSAEPFVTVICLSALLCYVLLFKIGEDNDAKLNEEEDEGIINSYSFTTKSLIITAVCALLTGFMILVEPVMVVVIMFLAIAGFALKKTGAFNIMLGFVGGLILFILLCLAKSGLTGLDIGETISGEMSSFEACTNQITGNEDDYETVFDKFKVSISSSEKSVSDNFYFITKSSGENVYDDLNGSWILIVNQIMYMFLLLMTISCIVMSVKENQKDSALAYWTLIGAVLSMFFSQNRESRGFFFVDILIICAAIGVHYLYLDHHPENVVSLNPLDALEKTGRKEIAKATRSNLQAARDMEDEEFSKRAEALIFIDSDEDLYNEIKKEEHKKLMSKDGHGNILDDTFDDYDDDFFLDSEDDVNEAVTVTSVAPSGTSKKVTQDKDAYEINANMHAAAKLNKAKIPVWKLKNNSYDNEDFDDFDEKDKNQNNGIKFEDEPVVTKISRQKTPKVPKANGNNTVNKKAKREDEIENTMKAVSTTTSKTVNGVPVRRVKTIMDSKNVSKKPAASETDDRFIPNPLPLPKKKDHVELDFDYDVDDDSDWDE